MLVLFIVVPFAREVSDTGNAICITARNLWLGDSSVFSDPLRIFWEICPEPETELLSWDLLFVSSPWFPEFHIFLFCIESFVFLRYIFSSFKKWVHKRYHL